MQRHSQDIGTVIENTLRAIAVVDVHIDNGGPTPGMQQLFCRDSGVVQVAESACLVGKGMMAWWAAQRIGRLLACQQQLCG